MTKMVCTRGLNINLAQCFLSEMCVFVCAELGWVLLRTLYHVSV